MKLLQRISVCLCHKNKTTPSIIEQKYVYETYDTIAQHFDHTRFARWPKVKAFLSSLETGSIVYDIGCGNCKYLNQKNLYAVGTDRSLKLLQVSKKRKQNVQVMASDALKLPIRSSSCDAALSIAVLHHLSSKALRLQALRQMIRIIRVGGRGLLYVWCLQQQLKNKESISQQLAAKIEGFDASQDVMVNWHLQDKYCQQLSLFERSHEKRSCLLKRYYHLFKRGELANLLLTFKDIEILQSSYDKENWTIQFKRSS